ncbi:MAG TPA: acetate--CoA ligase family protein [Alphaproteobacteria bacterium]|nr:acetate--CoA ligase family protein [Alphaproteobacteria bacterium]
MPTIVDPAVLFELALPLTDDSELALIPEPDVKRLLQDFGIRTPTGVTIAADLSGISQAAALTPPFALKAWGSGLVHKSDVGAVELGIRSSVEAEQAARRMSSRLQEKGIVPAGFLIEEQQKAGIEMIVGVVRRPPFGLFLAVGFGGTLTEILQDIALRPLPIGPGDAEAMLGELKGRSLLDGARGKPEVDMASLLALIEAIGSRDGLGLAVGARLAEFEINPVIAGESGAVAVDGRLLLYRNIKPAPQPDNERSDFEPLFRPRGIAVVGASAKGTNFGNMFLRNYKAFAFPGPLSAVHPEAREIDGVPAYPSLADVPHPVDYALVAAPAAMTPAIVRTAKGKVKFAQVMSGGFREAGSEGAALEPALVEAAREAGVRVLGPNCMGVWSARGRQTFLGSPPEREGDVAIISQSGSLGGDILKVGDRLGIGFSCLATIGNCVDVTAGELLEWLVDDPHTEIIGLYIEDPRDGERLIDALHAARVRCKPVVLLIAGISRQGARAAASHTGAMAGELRIWQGIAKHTGARLTHSLESFLDVLLLTQIGRGSSALGTDVLIVGAGGGCNVIATDACDLAGLTVAPVDTALAQLLSAEYGPGASFGNPVEVPMGPLNASSVAPKLLRQLNAGRPFANIVFHVNVQSFYSYGKSTEHSTRALFDLADELVKLAPELPRSRLAWVLRNSICAEGDAIARLRRTAHEGGVATFLTFDAAAAALAAVQGES